MLELWVPKDSSLVYNLLETEIFRRFSANPELLKMELEAAQKERPITHVLLDEIQRIPALLDEVHSIMEKKTGVCFALSGSSARKLKRNQANMLGGRAWTLRLYPFTVNELGDSFNLDRALRFGTLPSVWLANNDLSRTEILRSYTETYIKEEIEAEAQLRNVGTFLRFLPMAASENGAQLNMLNISREISTSLNTIRTYYQILEDTLIGFYLFPFAKSMRKKVARHPKFYFFDCGVVRALLKKTSVPIVEQSEEYGRSFEHFMICEIHRINQYCRLDLDITFYRTEAGAEVDCILTLPTGEFWAIEIKSTKSPSPAHCSGLRSFKKHFPDATCLIACCAPRAVQLGPFIAHPWQDVLQMIYKLGNQSS